MYYDLVKLFNVQHNIHPREKNLLYGEKDLDILKRPTPAHAAGQMVSEWRQVNVQTSRPI